MCCLLEKWVAIFDLKEMQQALLHSFSEVGEAKAWGKGVLVKKGQGHLLLGGHMDTVYEQPWPLRKEKTRWVGPGVADMKGGLVVLLAALKAVDLEWTLFINWDEERGSPESKEMWRELACEHKVALLFEPALEDGAFVVERKGSGNYTVEFTGKKAHVGRNFKDGVSAIHQMATFIEKVQSLAEIVNVGKVNGGTLRNVVADKASCQFNVRGDTWDEKRLSRLASKYGGVLKRESVRIAKKKDVALFKKLQESGKELGMQVIGKKSAGVCDGNLLFEFGVPCLDTMGVVGGCLHSEQEYVELSSLMERSKLAAHFLKKL